MFNDIEARIQAAVNQMGDETIASAASVARNFARSIASRGSKISAFDALHEYATVLESEWAKTQSGVSHAAE